MEKDTETLLILASHALRFATNHPYAATGIFGVAVGSGLTYKVMKFNEGRTAATKVFTPKVYELILQQAELRNLLEDSTTELRWETPEASIIITSEQREPLKELPVIEIFEN